VGKYTDSRCICLNFPIPIVCHKNHPNLFQWQYLHFDHHIRAFLFCNDLYLHLYFPRKVKADFLVCGLLLSIDSPADGKLVSLVVLLLLLLVVPQGLLHPLQQVLAFLLLGVVLGITRIQVLSH
jgi:hypothetical protein